MQLSVDSSVGYGSNPYQEEKTDIGYGGVDVYKRQSLCLSAFGAAAAALSADPGLSGDHGRSAYSAAAR